MLLRTQLFPVFTSEGIARYFLKRKRIEIFDPFCGEQYRILILSCLMKNKSILLPFLHFVEYFEMCPEGPSITIPTKCVFVFFYVISQTLNIYI